GAISRVVRSASSLSPLVGEGRGGGAHGGAQSYSTPRPPPHKGEGSRRDAARSAIALHPSEGSRGRWLGVRQYFLIATVRSTTIPAMCIASQIFAGFLAPSTRSAGLTRAVITSLS